ncbi:hypothetical protein LZ30DRAFT_142600 [Colletotrichum cereale]|nr:hypothetical protein LZ30DRAFT_142600 [Colletotrichum cereale]
MISYRPSTCDANLLSRTCLTLQAPSYIPQHLPLMGCSMITLALIVLNDQQCTHCCGSDYVATGFVTNRETMNLLITSSRASPSDYFATNGKEGLPHRSVSHVSLITFAAIFRRMGPFQISMISLWALSAVPAKTPSCSYNSNHVFNRVAKFESLWIRNPFKLLLRSQR